MKEFSRMMSRSTTTTLLPHFTTLKVSGRWPSSSSLTTSQGEGSHQADEKRLRPRKKVIKAPEAVSSLGNCPDPEHGVWPSQSPQPPSSPPCRGGPRKPQPLHRLWEPLQTAGLCDSTIPSPARRPGPRTGSWKSLRPPMTPFKASSVWLFDS